MPIEVRSIILTHEELVEAVRLHRQAEREPFPDATTAYRQVARGIIPDGEVIAGNADPERGLEVVIHAVEAGEARDIRIAMAPDEVLEMLIRFCIASGIPIPRRGRKTYQVDGNRVGLLIRIDG